MTVYERAKIQIALKANKISGGFIKEGYFNNVEDNLLLKKYKETVLPDFKDGSGNELESKIFAAHSSAMLAVNNFGYFKDNIKLLSILGQNDFDSLVFEAKCSTGLQGTPPNLDVLIKSDNTIIGIESKMLETLGEDNPKFADSYFNHNFKNAEKIWIDVMKKYRNANKMYFNVAQIIKHYLGLTNCYSDKEIKLLYIFWEPINWNDFKEYREHREEIEEFSDMVSKSKVDFAYMSYSELWNEWSQIPETSEYVKYLRDRYELSI